MPTQPSSTSPPGEPLAALGGCLAPGGLPHSGEPGRRNDPGPGLDVNPEPRVPVGRSPGTVGTLQPMLTHPRHSRLRIRMHYKSWPATEYTPQAESSMFCIATVASEGQKTSRICTKNKQQAITDKDKPHAAKSVRQHVDVPLPVGVDSMI